MLNILFALLVGLTMAGGTICTKLSATSGNVAEGNVRAILWLVLAMACYALSYTGFYKLTSRMEISLLSPSMQAVSTVSVLVVSVALLSESLSLYKVLGIGFLCLGLLVLALEYT